jgi:hypothetical protein
MASVVPTLSASELEQTVKDEEAWYEKIRDDKGLQPEELARLHLNIKNLLDHVRFLEQVVSALYGIASLTPNLESPWRCARAGDH